jgi:hypothetical protein
MKIHLHIERVVLEGVAIAGAEHRLFRTAISTELARLLQIDGLSDELRTSAFLTHVPAGTLRVGNENSAAKLGADVARSVHQGIGYSGVRRSESLGHELSQETRKSLPGGNSQ